MGEASEFFDVSENLFIFLKQKGSLQYLVTLQRPSILLREARYYSGPQCYLVLYLTQRRFLTFCVIYLCNYNSVHKKNLNLM